MIKELEQPIYFGKTSFPAEVINALEDGDIVFFCGAGISIGEGLPSFKGLVKNVFIECHESMNKEEETSFKDNLYDRTLGLLENRMNEGSSEINYAVRNAVINIIGKEHKGDLAVHEAILKLAKDTNDNFRIVTTNFDNYFEKIPNAKINQVHEAPFLPVPKPHKWKWPVYLHGRINKENDPHGANLIFTSADFGNAYLVERWASRFVSELFKEFKVILFVGYGVDDPIMRYLVDAIAAERRVYLHDGKYSKIAQAFAFDGFTDESSKNERMDQWRAKGIDAILYEKENDTDYSQFQAVLSELADWHTRQHKDKKILLEEYASKRPVSKLSEEVINSQVIRLISKDITLAKYFSEIDPLPSSEWYDVFYKANLFKSNKFASQPSELEHALYYWLTLQAKDERGSLKLIEIINSGEISNESFKIKIKYFLTNNKPVDNKIKKILIAFAYWSYQNQESDEQLWLTNRLGMLQEANFIKPILLELITPFIVLKTPYNYYKSNSNMLLSDMTVQDLISFDLAIQLEKYQLDELMTSSLDLMRNILPAMTHEITETLRKCLSICNYLESYDPTLHRHAISAHEQDEHNPNWMLIITLLREAYNLSDKKDQELILGYWKNIDEIIFKRFVLYAYSTTIHFSVDEKIDYLLSLNDQDYWKGSLKYEKCRLLESLSGILSSSKTDMLFAKILSGPPIIEYSFWDKRETTAKEKEDFKNRGIFEDLELLIRYKYKLNSEAGNLLKEIKEKYPKWEIYDDYKAEMSSWCETGRGNRSDHSADQLLNMPDNKLIEVLLGKDINKEEDNFNISMPGRLAEWQSAVKKQPERALRLYRYMLEEGVLDDRIIENTLYGLNTDNLFNASLSSEFIYLISITPESNIKTNIKTISFVLNKAYQNIEKESSFWEIWDKLQIISLEIPENDALPAGDLFSNAINHPAGILAETILLSLSKNKYKAGAGLEENTKKRISIILDTQTASSKYAKIVIYRGTYWFQVIDPPWADMKILPNFKINNSDAFYSWSGFLHSSNINPELFDNIYDDLCELLNKSGNLGLSSEKVGLLYQIFGLGLLYYQESMNAEQNKKVFSGINNEGLISLLIVFEQEVNNTDGLWGKAIKDIFHKYWPRSNLFKTPEVSKRVASLILLLDDDAANAYSELKDYLISLEGLKHSAFSLIHKIEKSTLLEKDPNLVLNILRKVLYANCQSYDIHSLPKIIELARNHGADVKGESYIWLLNLVSTKAI
ncbi:MAG TPA: hypothetical protein DCZ94_03125 [Lentisphaeria bacterium]|nr:MAG: hypothetical protein A2X48_15950 [Lentisphaerae bacterium GWF2_49_21]HBC85926.1 hypothetical protein [Lentisphaeria bacterium]